MKFLLNSSGSLKPANAAAEFNSAPPHFVSTKFGHLKFLILFLLLMYNNNAFTQLSITGNSFFRANTFGVEDHQFTISVKFNGGNYTSVGPLYTGSCGWETYSGSISPSQLYPNDLKIMPTTWNDASDYLNGVTVADIVAIVRHIENLVPITDGFLKVAADPASPLSTIDDDDVQQIRDLILGNRNDFTRTSWEWFNAYDISQLANFDGSPWGSIIGASGIDFNGISYSTIANNIARYFDYRSTKVGEVKKTTPNSWVCGTYSFAPNDIIKSRTTDETRILLPGMLLDLDIISKGSSSDCVGFEIPIHIDHNQFDLKNVSINGNFPAEFHYNADVDKLVILMADTKLKPHTIYVNQKLIHIKLEVKEKITDIDYQYFIRKERNVEFVNSLAEPLPLGIEFNISNVRSPSLKAEFNQDSKQNDIHIWNTLNQPLNIDIYDLNGQKLFSQLIPYSSGHEIIRFNYNTPGMYIAQINSNQQRLNLKFSIL